MYYPYLRGRQFELIALREYAQLDKASNKIIPIIEPVRKTFNSMRLALNKFKTESFPFALILNPEAGENLSMEMILGELQEELESSLEWIPTLILTSNYLRIKEIIEERHFHTVMLICSDAIDINNSGFESLISLSSVKYLVTKENRSLKKKISGKQKILLRLDDKFNDQRRNSDFIDIPDEKFSEEHLFYVDDGYQGFSDYTVVSSEYIEGGAAPYAVAIHFTYLKNDELWIRHFVSDSNGDRSNIQGKFAEAAEKAVKFLDEQKIETQASNELRHYFQTQSYPGLGMVKKISIKHHLELVNDILSNSK